MRALLIFCLFWKYHKGDLAGHCPIYICMVVLSANIQQGNAASVMQNYTQPGTFFKQQFLSHLYISVTVKVYVLSLFIILFYFIFKLNIFKLNLSYYHLASIKEIT